MKHARGKKNCPRCKGKGRVNPWDLPGTYPCRCTRPKKDKQAA